MRGVIYAHAGAACLTRIIVSLHSLRKHWKGPVTVFQEGKSSPELKAVCKVLEVDITEYDPVPYNNYTKKCHINMLTPYEVNMFLDADTLVCAPIDEYFEFVEQYGLVFTNFSNWTPKGNIMSGRIHKWDSLYPEAVASAFKYPVALNTGTYGFKKDHPFLEGWLKTSIEGAEIGVPLTDELAAQLLCQFFSHYVASIEWGYSVNYGIGMMPVEDAKVIHYHGRKHIGDKPTQKLWRKEFDEATKKWGLQGWGDKRVRRMLGRRPPAFKLPLEGEEPPKPVEPPVAATADGEKWVDILTLCIPRRSVEESMNNCIRAIDFSGYKTRWVVHLDPVPAAFSKEDEEETLQQIERASKLFDEVEVLRSEKNQGIGGSWKKLMENSKHDIVCWEDDKVAGKSTTMARVYEFDSDFVAFTSRRKRIGITNASFYKRKIILHILENWKEGWEEMDIELEQVAFLRKSPFSRASHWLSVKDIGHKKNADMKIVRVRKDGNSSMTYQKRDPRITFVTATDGNYIKKLKKNWKDWEWLQHIHVYPFLVFVDDSVTKEDRKWLAGLGDEVEVIDWDLPAAESQREKMLSAFVLGAPKHVKTSHWVKVDADVKFTKTAERYLGIVQDEWFNSDFTGHRWSFTRPKGGTWDKHWLNTLDEWWEEKTGEEPIFELIEDPMSRYSHKRINSFICMHDSEKMREVMELCGDRLPVPSHDTVLWYVAARKKWSVNRVNMKKRGANQ